jgi:hypothetical protein
VSNTESQSAAGSDKIALDLSKKLDSLLSAVADLKKGQDSMRCSFEAKIDNLRTELIANIDSKVRNLRDELSIDLNKEACRIDRVLTTIETLQTRMDAVERSRIPSGDESGAPSVNTGIRHRRDDHRGYQGNPLDDPDITITVSGVPVTENEDLIITANEIIDALGDEVSSNVLVTAASRLKTRIPNRPGLVKISFQNVHEKILVLRNKMNVKDSVKYKNCFLKSSKSHVERLIELNARTILRNLPDGKSLRVDANGRIKQRIQQDQQDANQQME